MSHSHKYKSSALTKALAAHRPLICALQIFIFALASATI